MRHFTFAISKFSRGDTAGHRLREGRPPAGGATPTRTFPQECLQPCAGLRPRCCDPHPSWGLYPPCLLSFRDLPPPLVIQPTGHISRVRIAILTPIIPTPAIPTPAFPTPVILTGLSCHCHVISMHRPSHCLNQRWVDINILPSKISAISTNFNHFLWASKSNPNSS